MEFFLLILLFAAGALLNSIGKKKGPRSRRGGNPETADEDASPDLMTEIRKALEQMREAPGQDSRSLPARRSPPVGRNPRGVAPTSRPRLAPIADEEEWEEGFSLEGPEPEVRSLENLTPRAERVVVDQDDQAEAIVAGRLRWADDHGKRKSMAEHREFDRQVRATAAAAKPGPEIERRTRLRDRMIWAEILGKPLALRNDERN